jgi:beta-N-acetylhexosaminidase
LQKNDLASRMNHFLLNVSLKILLLLILFPGFSTEGSAQQISKDNFACQHWVDSVYNCLSPTERIGQLFMVRANSTMDSAEIRQVTSWITKYDLGGICFFKGSPVRQALLTNYYQSLAKTPIMISMDAEWGLGMRLDSTMAFARQMTLGAISDESLIVRYGEEIARQLKRLGVRVSFSPVADINSNPENPVINVRSFGEDKKEVSRRAILYMKGLQKGGVMSVAKHFPGHGDTDTDSHLALPIIDHSPATLDTLDLYPFKKLIKAGVDGVMIAHLFVPALDSSRNLPTSLSPRVINELLRQKMGFNGLIFTDALDMKGAANFAPPGMLEVKALLAGNDILLLPESMDNAVAYILSALDSGFIAAYVIEEHCKRVLKAKYQLGLEKTPIIKIEGIEDDLHTSASEQLNADLYAEGITLLSNHENLLPLARLDTLRIASVTFGYKDITLFQERLSSYTKVNHFCIPRETELSYLSILKENLANYNLLILSANNTHPSPAKRFGLTEPEIALMDSLIAFRPCILNLFAIPYAVDQFRNASLSKALMVSYQDNAYSYDLAAQLIFGGIAAKGKSPVTISEDFPLLSGIIGDKVTRLKFSRPEDAGIPANYLSRIDSIVMEGIRQKAYPGCQVLVAKEGKVIYNKSFGFHDYSAKEPVRNSDLYDLASITKVAATTLAVMKLHDEHRIDPRKPLSKYLPLLVGTNKSKITVQEVMAHQSGLIPWIPFYKSLLLNGVADTNVFTRKMDPLHQMRVSKDMYIRNDYPAIMLDSILKSPLASKKEYKYSDLGFILMQKAIEHISGMRLDSFANVNFYRPMGLPTMGFLPLEKFELNRIIPTENDTLFRKQLVHGDVHDPAAAMMGGVAGHAGLFSNATDLAVLFQMLLQDGVYGGRRYIDSATVEEFISKQFSQNRRGLGFDKPQPVGEEGPACRDASPRSYGHTGFTGTYVWADPDQQLIIVFLANRVNPDAEDNKLARMGIRTRIQQVVYDAIREARMLPSQQPHFQLNTTY